METRKTYILPAQYNGLEDKVSRIRRIVDYERTTVPGQPLEELVDAYMEQLLGAREISRLLEDTLLCANQMSVMALTALSDLRRVKDVSPEAAHALSVDTGAFETEIIRALSLLSRFTPSITERVVSSIYNTTEVYYRPLLGERMEDAYSEAE